ncbi:MAG: hypothetical protein KatS3mg079_639 [Caloramator sp.]|uniref:Putative transcriptional regulator n=1 Tax=Caloramator proteoclasticus DSM 10124 TaxID=1121262 RepID=A0A1M5C986_9CLOT|nr:helix-turn-helix transcriptional regulator [Caloramator proteoclasticus]GIW49163.1 MAG: hypothetical protein KatS3mg079_639 [Caloramator sp.]SHF50972.1 putative transcriptional regulator [Caloramator proteoclasticus DSM 10124]
MKFKELRIKAGFQTAKEAAKSLGISYSMYHKIETGYREPGKELIKKMCEIFHCSIEDIFLAIEVTKSDNKNTA